MKLFTLNLNIRHLTQIKSHWNVLNWNLSIQVFLCGLPLCNLTDNLNHNTGYHSHSNRTESNMRHLSMDSTGCSLQNLLELPRCNLTDNLYHKRGDHSHSNRTESNMLHLSKESCHYTIQRKMNMMLVKWL